MLFTCIRNTSFGFKKYRVVFLALCLSRCASAPAPAHAEDQPSTPEGVHFECSTATNPAFNVEMSEYLMSLGVSRSMYVVKRDNGGYPSYILTTPTSDTDTLSLSVRPEYHIQPDMVELPLAGGIKAIPVTSKKEIVLALFQHGRTTLFSNEGCSVSAFKDHVGVRQNIVAWTTSLEWDWPNGGSARWNPTYWKKGTPLPGYGVPLVFLDAFQQQSKYAIGCYTATKLAIVQGIVDYYYRIKKDYVTLNRIEHRLLQDNEPLVDIEPSGMWYFEEGHQPDKVPTTGKLTTLNTTVPPNNFVPGDWSYILNTDRKSAQKTGYEGSNALYLGANTFDDYYNDHRHGYTFKEKLSEVYQWRFGVFSLSRDIAKIHPLTAQDVLRLSQPPENAGLLLSYRVTPLISW